MKWRNHWNHRPPRRIARALVLATLMAALGVCAGCGRNASSEEGDTPRVRSADEVQNAILTERDFVSDGTGVEDFVIFGVDTRSDELEYTRSDSIILVHIDYEEETVKMCSIYRDCLAHIDGYDYTKITHAHWYGGPDLALETINENYDLDLEAYMTLNFINFADLVDEIGGVEMEITEEEVSHLSDIDGAYTGKITEPGTYQLDGDQALAYSRIRHAEGADYRRSERQRDVLTSLFEKAKAQSANDRISLAEDLLGQINSNLRTEDLEQLLYNLSDFEITETTAYPQVFYAGWIDGVWEEVPVTLVDMATGIHEFLFEETDYTPSETVQTYSDYMLTIESKPNRNSTNEGDD